MSAFPSGTYPRAKSVTGFPATIADDALNAWILTQPNIYIIGFSSTDDINNSQSTRTVLYTILPNQHFFAY